MFRFTHQWDPAQLNYNIKGIVHSKLKFHPFTAHPDANGSSDDILESIQSFLNFTEVTIFLPTTAKDSDVKKKMLAGQQLAPIIWNPLPLWGF